MEADLNDVMRAIGTLEGTMKTGFGAINQRLDTVNGRLGKHDDRIAWLETKDAREEGREGAFSFLATLFAGAVGLVAGIAGSFIQAGKLF